MLARESKVAAQNPALISKEGLASAAVLLAALTALPDVPPAHLAALLAGAMWPELQSQLELPASTKQHTLGSGGGSMGSPVPSNGQKVGIVEGHLQSAGTKLAERLSGMEQLSRVCALKGLVSVLPLAALCTAFALRQRGSNAAAVAVAAIDSRQPPAQQGDAKQATGPRSFPALDERFAQQHANGSAISDASAMHAKAQTGRHNHSKAQPSHFMLCRGPKWEDVLPPAPIWQVLTKLLLCGGCGSHPLRCSDTGLYSAGSEVRQGQDAGDSWTFLMHGAIPFACDAVAAAPDAHQKLHATALLTTCLQRMKEGLEVGNCHLCIICLCTIIALPSVLAP